MSGVKSYGMTYPDITGIWPQFQGGTAQSAFNAGVLEDIMARQGINVQGGLNPNWANEPSAQDFGTLLHYNAPFFGQTGLPSQIGVQGQFLQQAGYGQDVINQIMGIEQGAVPGQYMQDINQIGQLLAPGGYTPFSAFPNLTWNNLYGSVSPEIAAMTQNYNPGMFSAPNMPQSFAPPAWDPSSLSVFSGGTDYLMPGGGGDPNGGAGDGGAGAGAGDGGAGGGAGDGGDGGF